jgi:hypothetical protein
MFASALTIRVSFGSRNVPSPGISPLSKVGKWFQWENIDKYLENDKPCHKDDKKQK